MKFPKSDFLERIGIHVYYADEIGKWREALRERLEIEKKNDPAKIVADSIDGYKRGKAYLARQVLEWLKE